jgi:hypothetical protein
MYSPNPRERHKAIAVPVTMINDRAHMLIVHDRRYKEWTFVTGGCRRREVYNPLRCAIRELHEETRGLIDVKSGSYTYFRFTTNYKGPGDTEADADTVSVYHVYVLDLPMTPIEQKYMIQRFNEEKVKMESSQVPFKKNHDENTAIIWDTLEGISGRHDLWILVRECIINNPDFTKALHASNKTPFYLRS